MKKGQKMSEEQKRKISNSSKGKHAYLWSEEVIKKRKGHIPWNKNKKWSKKVRDKIRKSRKGQKASNKTKQKMSLSRRGSNHPNWKGGKLLWNGYIKLRIGNGYKFEHRLIAEKILNRKLKHCEYVHHLDGNGMNNNPMNLVVLSNKNHHKLNNIFWQELLKINHKKFSLFNFMNKVLKKSNGIWLGRGRKK